LQQQQQQWFLFVPHVKHIAATAEHIAAAAAATAEHIAAAAVDFVCSTCRT
jgi:hypothetical protein